MKFDVCLKFPDVEHKWVHEANDCCEVVDYVWDAIGLDTLVSISITPCVDQTVPATEYGDADFSPR